MTSMASIREPWPDTCAATGDFMEFAACRRVDPAVFYPEIGVSSGGAKALCHSCSVMDECLEYAFEHNEIYGIWGGKSENERRKLKRTRTRSYVALAGNGEEGCTQVREVRKTCKSGHDKARHWDIDSGGRGRCKECRRIRSRERWWLQDKC